MLDRPELGGGVKVVFQHARLLHESGHVVTILARGPEPVWIGFPGVYENYESGMPSLPSQDLVIGTWWETLPVADALSMGPVVHFCQGYEGDLAHLAPVKSQIEDVYQRPRPTFVVSPHLAKMLGDRYGRESFLVPPPLDPLFRPAWRFRPKRIPWVMIAGIFEAEVKGIPTALAAIRMLRSAGQECRVLRLSVLPLSATEEALLKPERYLCGVSPTQVAEALRACDLLLFPSLAMEGFGLPVLEALISKVPVVASEIPALGHLSEPAVIKVPVKDSEAFAASARTLLQDSSRWRKARRSGHDAAQAFRPEAIARRLDAAIQWAEKAREILP